METFSHETLEPWFVTGIVEGIGSFTFSRSSRQIALYFSLKSQRDLLLRIQAFFGLGRIYSTSGGLSLFRVTRINELLHVALHFKAYPLQGERLRVFELWHEMLEIKRAFRKPRPQELEALAVALSKISSEI